MRRRFRVADLAAIVCLTALFSGCGGARSDPNAREAAEWVLQSGGTLRVTTSTLPVDDPINIPQDDFGIVQIELQEAKITNQDLEKLSGLTNLEYLGLYRTPVGDEGLQHLVPLSDSLSELNLSMTNVTDKGMDTLAQLKNLKRVFLRNTLVTEQGIETLATQLPDCRIINK